MSHKEYHCDEMCKTRLKMTKISLKFKQLIATVESVSLFSLAGKLEIIKKNKAVIKKQLSLYSY